MAKPDYPKTILEFAAAFNSDDVCLEYLVSSRWPEGFVCPHCRNQGGWWLKSYRRFQCTRCHRQTSPLAKTLMHRSHLPIRTWFWAAYLVSTHTPGISAVQLQRQLGIGQVRSAWFLLHRLRQAMVKGNRKPLEGCVEWGIFEVGSPLPGIRDHGVIKAARKTLVAGAVEVHRTRAEKEVVGKLRLQVLPSASHVAVQKFLLQNVAEGSTLRGGLGEKAQDVLVERYHRHSMAISGGSRSRAEHSLHIGRAFDNLRGWLNGIHHGVNRRYLQAYLDEFVFRFNRRDRPMSAFRSLLGILTEKPPLELQSLTMSRERPTNRR